MQLRARSNLTALRQVAQPEEPIAKCGPKSAYEPPIRRDEATALIESESDVKGIVDGAALHEGDFHGGLENAGARMELNVSSYDVDSLASVGLRHLPQPDLLDQCVRRFDLQQVRRDELVVGFQESTGMLGEVL